MLRGGCLHGLPRRCSQLLSSPRTWQQSHSRHILSQCLTTRGYRSSSIRLAPNTSPIPSSGNDDQKLFYITTPIFYVNAAPHVGHLYSMVLADIIKRWELLKGRKALLCTGTDEHGMKVQQAAAAAKTAPETFVNAGAEVFKSLAAVAGLSNDHFVRTTDADHKEAVQYAWALLQDRGYIYLSKHEGWYAVSDETYYPQSGVHLIVEPSTGRKIMASIETGKEVEWTSETNYKFRLSLFRDRLLAHYASNPSFILPAFRHTEVTSAVTSSLEDLSISRPRERLSWGIPVPGDETQTIYVWIDALTNYITKAGYPFAPGKESALGWPADVQVIGKDIVRFHCIYWPALLMALDLPLPKHVLTHGHWTLGRQKMAKSTGNVVNPFFAIDRFGKDVMRFYLAHDGNLQGDADYSNEYIVERYKKALYGGFGNLTSRITRGKGWSIRRAVERAANGEMQEWEGYHLRTQVGHLKAAPQQFRERMDALDVHNAVKNLVMIVYNTNAFLQQTAPWNLAQALKAIPDPQPSDTLEIDRFIYLAAEAVRITGILMLPVMPEKMSAMLDMIGVSPEMRTLEFAEFGKDGEYGVSSVPLGRGLLGTLFPPLVSD